MIKNFKNFIPKHTGSFNIPLDLEEEINDTIVCINLQGKDYLIKDSDLEVLKPFFEKNDQEYKKVKKYSWSIPYLFIFNNELKIGKINQ